MQEFKLPEGFKISHDFDTCYHYKREESNYDFWFTHKLEYDKLREDPRVDIIWHTKRGTFIKVLKYVV